LIVGDERASVHASTIFILMTLLWAIIHVFLAYAWLYSSTDATVHHSVPPVFGATSAPLDSPVRVSLVGPSLQVHSTLVSWGEPRFARFLKATWSAL